MTVDSSGAAAGGSGASARTIRIGLTGPIGCGKSTVAGWLAARGAVVIDADDVARAVSAPGAPGHDAVLAVFGNAVRVDDGSLDRAALARIVFRDPEALRRLEAILHPLVRTRILATIEAARATDAPAVVVEAIKLVEGGLAALCDEVWLVTCDAGEQLERLLARGTIAADDAQARIAAQAGLAERLVPAATRVIDTSGPAAATAKLVEAAWFAALEGYGAGKAR